MRSRARILRIRNEFEVVMGSSHMKAGHGREGFRAGEEPRVVTISSI